jgi:hypothetical protein
VNWLKRGLLARGLDGGRARGHEEFPHGPAGQHDAMRVMDEAVEDRVPKRGVADQVVPVLDRDLTRDEGGALPRAVFDDFEEVAPFPIAHRSEAPVVQN